MQTFYTVQPGDTLWQIATRWDIPLASLIAANNLTQSSTIFIGQQLSMPPGVGVYRVQTGDTVYRIAQKYRIPSQLIIATNQLHPPYILQVGQLLIVPPGPKFYIVQPRDTLYKIARRYNVITGGQVNDELIREVNQLPNDMIFVGQQLIIPYAPPGEKGQIAYVDNRKGNYDVWIYNLQDGSNKQITNGLAASFSVPYWSPDARKIAFVGKDNVLFVIHIQTKEVARIDQFEDGFGHYIDWSSDNEFIVYSKPNNIVIYNLNTHQSRILNRRNTTDAQWFPTGDEILFQAPDSEGVSQLYRVNIEGNLRQITQNTAGRYNHVRLSPDGKEVLYTTPGASISIIHIMILATGEDMEIPGGPLGRNYNPEWSTNSQFIAYSANAYQKIGYMTQVRIFDRRTGMDHIQAISNCFSTPVTWSPNSQKIAYLSGCQEQGEAREIWMLDLKHPVPIQLTQGGHIVSLQWAPS